MIKENKTKSKICKDKESIKLQRLEENVEKYHSIFNNMPNGFAISKMIFENDHPIDFTYLEVNESFKRLTGLRNVIGRNASEVIPNFNVSNPEYLEIYGRVALTGQQETFEMRSILKKWFSVSVHSPQKEYFVIVFDEITERKKTEEALKESQKEYTNLFEKMNEGFAIAEMIYNDEDEPFDFRWIDVNPSFEKSIGFTRDILLKNTARALFPKVSPKLVKNFGKVMLTGKQLHFENYNFELKHWTDVIAYKITPKHFAYFTFDITERKKTEELNQKLLESEQQLIEELQTSNEELQSTTEELQVTNEELRNQGAELLRINKTLDESEVRYRNIIENIQDAYIRADKDGNIIMVSPSAAKIYRFDSTHEMIGLSARSLYKNQEDRISLITELDKYGKVEDFESEALRKDGTSFIVSLNSQFHHDDEGQIQGTEAFVRDISERKQAEDNQEKLSKQLQVALDAANMGWWHYNPITDIATYDNRYKEIFGVVGSESPNDEILKLLHPDDTPGVWSKVEEALDPINPREYCAEYRIYRNNEIRWIEAHGITTFEGYGKEKHAVSLVGTVNDITERKKSEEYRQKLLEFEQELTEELQTSNEELQSTTEELQVSNEELRNQEDKLLKSNLALKDSEAQFRILINNLESGVALMDEIGEFIIVNPSFMRMFGLGNEDVLNIYSQDWDQWKVYGKDGNLLDVDEHPVRKAVITCKSVQNQIVSVKNPGADALTWMLISAEPLLNKDGTINKIICTYNDVTEIKKAEEELSKSNIELKRSNEELERFAYVSSHDLQEPLRMVTLYSQLLERRYKDNFDSDADDFIEYIVEGAQRMRLLIDDLLEYSRVKSQAAEFNRVNFDQVLDAVLHNLAVSIDENNVNISHDSLPNIFADKNQMVHVFQNLISNAIKFHGPNSPEINISAQKDGKKWKFKVQDNGIGIKPEHQKQIFEVFKRLHTKEQYPGTGIGLSITQKIIQHHGGKIWVESELGKGTTFFFTIPINQKNNNFF